MRYFNPKLIYTLHAFYKKQCILYERESSVWPKIHNFAVGGPNSEKDGYL